MRIPDRILLSALLLSAFLALTACSSTEIVGRWTAPQYRGGEMDSVLVVGKVNDATLRRALEDRFVATLQERGVKAEPSYRVLPDAAAMELGAIQERVQALGLQGILVTRLTGQERVQVRQPTYGPYGPYAPYGYYGAYSHPFYGPRASWPYYRGGYDYYGLAPQFTPETMEETVFRMETSLYATGGAGLVWSAQTKTTARETPVAEVDDVVDKLAAEMEKDGVI